MNLDAVVIQTLGSAAPLAVAAALGLLCAVSLPAGRRALSRTVGGRVRHPVGWGWTAAFVATVGSLYLSEKVGFAPCSLCWYQRIAMYPLVLVLGVGLIREDAGVWRYGIPLALGGLAISVYHVALQLRPTLDVGACTSGVPCSARYLSVYGFVTIPVMAGSAFLLVAASLLVVRALEGGVRARTEEEG